MTARRIPIWSRVAFAVLLPFVAYSIWDYVEARRLESRITAVQRRGEPTTSMYEPAKGNAAEAQRLYRAAGALLRDGFNAPAVLRNQTDNALRQGKWTADTLEFARTMIRENREALGFADRASRLPIVAFSPVAYNYPFVDLMRLCRLCEYRAALLAADGKGDDALAAYYVEIGVARALGSVPLPVGTDFLPNFSGLSAAIQGGRPSSAARERLAQAFAEIDRDDRLRVALLTARAHMLSDDRWYGIPSQIRPLEAHRRIRSLDRLAALLAVADRPWPHRIEAMNALGMWPSTIVPQGSDGQARMKAYTKYFAEQVKRIRCARLLVSPTPLDLVDPLTGKTLEVSACHL